MANLINTLSTIHRKKKTDRQTISRQNMNKEVKTKKLNNDIISPNAVTFRSPPNESW
jgi:hypothetical protein